VNVWAAPFSFIHLVNKELGPETLDERSSSWYTVVANVVLPTTSKHHQTHRALYLITIWSSSSKGRSESVRPFLCTL
jgi:hypothetical protein